MVLNLEKLELGQVLLRILTDFSLYETSIKEKRVQYSTQEDVCFEGYFYFS